MSSTGAKSHFPLLAAFALILLQAGPAHSAGDLCIRCTQPDDTYICRIRSGTSGSEGQQLFCIMSIAQQYGHGSCAVNLQNACSGRLVEYDLPQGLPDNTLHDRQAIREESDAEGAKVPSAAVPGAAREPKTLLEFTQQTAAATKKGIKSVGESTGEAIGSTGEKVEGFTKSIGEGVKQATQKTFNCITSLFTRCGE